MNRELILNISGKVQGVYFRVYTQKEALRLGLTGFVKNEADGSVTIVAQGKKDSLNKLFEWAKQGPSLAYIKTINLKWQETEKKYIGFSIQK